MTEPSREVGTCAECGVLGPLRTSPTTPYPPLPVQHTHKHERYAGQFDDVPCDGWARVCREWQDYITSDPDRLAAYEARYEAWRVQCTSVAQIEEAMR